jgi:hypothetical protein
MLKSSGNMTVGNTSAADKLTTIDGTLRTVHTQHVRPISEAETVNRTIYWNVTVPLTAGIGGSCIGNATFIAQEDT